MSLIKFPTHINPARLTVTLLRVDETIRSPATNVQQVAFRGNPAWQWTYEYKDLSDSERDVVQAFLLNCKGAVNTFRVTDPADYHLSGAVSNWIDVFSGRGSFNSIVGSTTSFVNSYFSTNVFLDHHIADDQTLLHSWANLVSVTGLLWRGEGTAGRVSSLQQGAAYVQRIKLFQSPDKAVMGGVLSIGSGAIDVNVSAGPVVRSSDMLTTPFNVGHFTSYYVAAFSVRVNSGVGEIGDSWSLADYQLKRCALVANSENLVTKSNEFDHADWTAVNISVESGWMDRNPKGVSSGGWKLWGDTSVNTHHYIEQQVTRVSTSEVYTAAIYAQIGEHNQVAVEITDSGGSNSAKAIFNVDSKTATIPTLAGNTEFPHANAIDTGSGTLRCALRATVRSVVNIKARYYLVNSDGSEQFTNNGSAGVQIFGASLRKFPFAGPYVPTDATAIVGTDWQSGSNVILDGFDPGDILKAGQRFEIVNRFASNSGDLYERSEFKRITRETKVGAEGNVVIPFDPPIRNRPEYGRTEADFNHNGETIHNPVIFHKPEMKARLVNGTIQYTEKSLTLTDITFEVLEDMTE
jgi:hypothetical protein